MRFYQEGKLIFTCILKEVFCLLIDIFGALRRKFVLLGLSFHMPIEIPIFRQVNGNDFAPFS